MIGIIEIIGGLALFLYGIRLLSVGHGKTGRRPDPEMAGPGDQQPAEERWLWRRCDRFPAEQRLADGHHDRSDQCQPDDRDAIDRRHARTGDRHDDHRPDRGFRHRPATGCCWSFWASSSWSISRNRDWKKYGEILMGMGIDLRRDELHGVMPSTSGGDPQSLLSTAGGNQPASLVGDPRRSGARLPSRRAAPR